MLGITIKKMIEDALPFAGLAASPIQNDILQVALGIVNFEGQMLYDRWPFDAEKDTVVAYVGHDGIITFPQEVDAIRALRALSSPSIVIPDGIKVVSGSSSDVTMLRTIQTSDGAPVYRYSYVDLSRSEDDHKWYLQILVGPLVYYTSKSAGLDLPPMTPDEWDIVDGVEPAPTLIFKDGDGDVLLPLSYNPDDSSVPILAKDDVSAWIKDTDIISHSEYHHLSNTEDKCRRIQVNTELVGTYVIASVLQHFVPFSESDYGTRKFPIDRAEAALKGELIDGLREFMGMEKTNKGEKAYKIGVNREEKQQQKPQRVTPKHPIFSDDGE